MAWTDGGAFVSAAAGRAQNERGGGGKGHGGIAEDDMDKQPKEERPNTEAEAIAKFQATCAAIAERGTLVNIANSMTDRMRDIFDADGGPTRW